MMKVGYKRLLCLTGFNVSAPVVLRSLGSVFKKQVEFTLIHFVIDVHEQLYPDVEELKSGYDRDH